MHNLFTNYLQLLYNTLYPLIVIKLFKVVLYNPNFSSRVFKSEVLGTGLFSCKLRSFSKLRRIFKKFSFMLNLFPFQMELYLKKFFCMCENELSEIVT